MLKITYFNNRKKDNIDLDLAILKSNNGLIQNGLPFEEYKIIQGDIPTDKDFTTISTSVGTYEVLNYGFYKSQIDKYLENDADICVFCYSPDGTTRINISEPTNVYKMNCCQCIIDGDDAWRYIRHEIIHAYHWIALLQELPVVDDQDQREKDENAYFTASPDIKDRIERENLQDVLKVLDKIKPNKSVSLVHGMLSSVVLLLTQLVGLLKKKPNKDKAYFIDYAIQMARKHFVDEKVLCAVIEAESSWNPNAINKNSDGSNDIGIVQINSYWGIGLGSRSAIKGEFYFESGEWIKNNPEFCIEGMAQQFQKGRENDWSAYKNGNYKKYLNNY